MQNNRVKKLSEFMLFTQTAEKQLAAQSGVTRNVPESELRNAVN